MYAIKRPDGKVSILVIAEKSPLSEEEALAKAIPEGCPYRKIEPKDLPDSRVFRDAWTDDLDSDTVDVDEDKAKEIHMGRIRKMRDKKLAEEDLEMLKNMGDSAKLKEIEKKKQKLRDIPATFDLSGLDVKDPAKLWPEELELCKEYIGE